MRLRSPLVGLLAVALALGAGACSRTQTAKPTAGPLAPGYWVQSAERNGASPEQVAILRKSDVPSFEDYEAATRRSLACMEDAGIQTWGPDSGHKNGVAVLTYREAGESPGRTPKQTLDVIDACEAQHANYVRGAWELQPIAIEAEQGRFEAARPELYACAARIGLKLEPDLPIRDLIGQIGDYMNTLPGQGSNSNENCFAALDEPR
jgi:hypothetical protein